MTRAAVAVNVRQPTTVLFGFVMPIGIIIVFQLIGQEVLGGDNVANQVVPGILAYSIANASLSASALTFTAWRNSGLLTRLRLEPITGWQILFSRYLVTAAITMLQTVVFLLLGVAFLGLEVALEFWWLGFICVLMGSLVFFVIGGLVGLISKSEQAVSAGLNLVLLPLAFLSGSFVPMSSLPDGIQAVMQFTPLAALTQGLVESMSGQFLESGLWLVLIVLVVWLVISAAATTTVYRRRNTDNG
nr:ABC transporter permease [Auritidibacter sp. NML100628]